MSRSNREIPHYHVGETIDLGRASEWLVAENERRPLPERLLMGVLLVRAVALALREHPALNALWQDERAVRSHGDPRRRRRLAARGRPDRAGAARRRPALARRPDGVVPRRRRPGAPRRPARVGALRLDDHRDQPRRGRGRGGLRASSSRHRSRSSASAASSRGRGSPTDVVVPRPIVRATLAADHRASDGHAGSAFLRTLDRLLQEPEDL